MCIRDSIKAWYDGYVIESSNIKMYSVWSIVHYLGSGKLKSYWVDSGSMTNLDELVFQDKIRTKILEMLDSKIVQIKFVTTIEVKHIISLRNIILQQIKELDDSDSDLFLQFMADNGYFDIINVTFDNRAFLKIPNNKICYELKSVVNSVCY